MVALSLWYSAANDDHFTLASDASKQWALAHGYVMINENVGWAYPAPSARRTAPGAAAVGFNFVNASRYARALTLLQCATGSCLA
jgi:hypothetical protein